MPFEGPRELTDPLAMRAMAHPVRLALMEALNHHGALTATEAAERVGESPSNCSFHLRQLAKYGFVEEAEGGTGRQRPWRVVTSACASPTCRRTPRRRWPPARWPACVRALARARACGDGAAPAPARGVARRHRLDEMTLYVTPDEMRAVNDEILENLWRFRERIADPAKRPEGSRAVELAIFLPRRSLMRRVLARRDMRLYLAGQTLSLFGDTALWLALGIWAKELTGSSAAAGMVMFFLAAPQLLSPLSGLLVDRVRRRPLLIVANLATAAAVLPLLLVHDRGDVWILYAVTAAYGFSFTVLGSGQSALLATLLPDDELADANARPADRPRGPAAGRAAGRRGAVHRGRRSGRPLLDAATFVLAAGALALMRTPDPRPEPSADGGLAAGARHVRAPCRCAG